MLAEFRVENYRSFKDEQVLSLIASSDESKGKNSIEVGGHSILKTAVVYGANASGKSNLIKALACMKTITCGSAGYKPSDKLPVVPFLFDEKTKSAPTTFEATFFMEGIRYQYGFSATKEKIHREWLLAWPKGKEQKWFERDCEEAEPYFGPSLKGQNKSTWGKVKDNSLFLSVAAQWNHKQLSKVYNWFESNFDELPDGFVATYATDMLFSLSHPDDDKFFYNLVIKMIRQADFGIDDLEVEKLSAESHEILGKISEEAKQKVSNFILTHPPCKITLYHCGGKYSLDFEEESDGTQRFYSLLGPLVTAMASGTTIFKDELELNMHPLLTREIVNFVSDNKIIDNCAQLFFTTHDTTLLDPELFGRDQVWFTEKDEFGATQLYSLADYKESTVRKGEAMQKRYLAGRYGAVPILERFDLGGTKKK